MLSQIPSLILVIWNFSLLFLIEFQKGLESILLIVSIIVTVIKIFEFFEKRFGKKKK